MPSAASYTNKIRFAASVKNTKAQLPGGVGNITQPSAAGCGLNIQYNPIEYVEICECKVNLPIVPPPVPPPTINNFLEINQPNGMVRRGNSYYITSFTDCVIYKYDSITGSRAAIITNISFPRAPKIDTNGNIFIPMRDESVQTSVIKKIDNNDVVTDFYTYPYTDEVQEITISNSGLIYVAESQSYKISVITQSGVRTLVSSVTFGITGISIDPTNQYLYLIDSQNSTLLKYNISTSSYIIQLRVSDRAYDMIGGLDIDSAGNLYIAFNSGYKILRLSPSGIVDTVVGTGLSGYSGDGGLAIAATIRDTYRINVDKERKLLYVSDFSNNHVRVVSNLVQ